MPAKKSPNTKQRSKRNSAQWIRNAAKSLGMTGLDVVKEIIPNNRKVVTIEKDLQQGFDYRKITISDQL